MRRELMLLLITLMDIVCGRSPSAWLSIFKRIIGSNQRSAAAASEVRACADVFVFSLHFSVFTHSFLSDTPLSRSPTIPLSPQRAARRRRKATRTRAAASPPSAAVPATRPRRRPRARLILD